MKKRSAWGSEFSDPKAVVKETLELCFGPRHKWQTFGIRLVHDESVRAIRGGPWGIPGPGETLRAWEQPKFSGRSVGIRLAKESK
jgi:hypothetical protein